MQQHDLDDLLSNNPKIDPEMVREIRERLEEAGYIPKSRYRIAHPFARRRRKIDRRVRRTRRYSGLRS